MRLAAEVVPKQVRKALLAQSRQAGAKPHSGASYTRRSAEVAPKQACKALVAQKSPTRRKDRQTRRSQRAVVLPVRISIYPARNKAGQGRAGDARSAGVHGINMYTSPPVKLVWWSAAVPKSCSNRSAQSCNEAALATPYKRAKP